VLGVVWGVSCCVTLLKKARFSHNGTGVKSVVRIRVTYRREYVVSEEVDSVVLPTLIAHHTPTFIYHVIALRGLSWCRVDHEGKVRSRSQRTDIGKYSFVNRTIQDWNQLPAEVLGTLPCNLKTLKKRARKAIIEMS